MSISRRTLLIRLASVSLLMVLFLVFIVGLPWRWALQQRIADLKARGEPTTMADLKPKAVPEADNGGHLLEAIWQDIGSSDAFRKAGYFHSSDRMEDNVATLRQRLGLPSPEAQEKRDAASLSGFHQQVDDVAALMKTHPDLLARFDLALRKAHFQFKLDYSQPSFSSNFYFPPLGKCRQTINFLSDLSIYELALGKREDAQRCRLLMLRSPLPLDEPPNFLINALVRVAISGLALDKLAHELPLLTDTELRQLQAAAADLKPWAAPERMMRVSERAFSLTADFKSPDYNPIIGFGNAADFKTRAKDSLFHHTAWIDADYLHAIDHCGAEIDGRPWGGMHSYLWDQSELNWISVRVKCKDEISQLTQFRLGLEIESLKRVKGAYPSDLSGISLSHLDADGKPMSYQIVNEGRGAFLDFVEKRSGRNHKLFLGEVPLKLR